MFAGDGAAFGDAEPENFAAERLGALQFAGFADVIEDQGMQVAVPGMEHIDHGQAIAARHLADGAQHLGQVFARYGAVHAVIIGGDAAHGRKGGLAPGPETLRLACVLGDPYLARVKVLQQGLNLPADRPHLRLAAVQFADQDGLGVQRITGPDKVLHGPDRGLVHHLQTGRDDAAGDNGGHRRARLPDIGKGRQHHPRTGRSRQQFNRDLHDHAEQALGAGHQGQQIIARRIRRMTAHGEQFPGYREQL